MNRMLCAATVAAALALASAAHAQTTGYSLQLSGNNFNEPVLRLTNTSDAAQLTAFSLTIGDTAFNFDSVSNENVTPVGSLTFSLVTPDRDGSGGVRSNSVEYTFAGFDPGELFLFETDVDPDSINQTVDYRTVLFDLGGSSSADNSLVSVLFSNGVTLSGNLPDFTPNTANTYLFAQSQQAPPPGAAIPEPGTFALAGSGLLPLLGMIRRRKA